MKKILLFVFLILGVVILLQWQSGLAIGSRVLFCESVIVKAMNLQGKRVSVEQIRESVLLKKEEERMREEFLDSCIEEMTMDQKLSQLMILTNEKDITEQNLRQFQPGGIIFFGVDFNGKTKEMVSQRVNTLQSFMKYPLLVGVDEEGGEVSRISGLLDEGIPVFKSARELGDAKDWGAVKEETVTKAELLQSMGINVNFDPVADVVTKKSAYMYKRSAGGDAGIVSEYVKSVTETMGEENVISCLKHFPGYGNNGNTHRSYIQDSRSMDSYKNTDFIPFETGIQAGADMVMVSHLVMGAVDKERPASLSAKVHELLRSDFGFDGVMIADDLNMQAVLSQMTLEEASGAALAAGNDMIFSADFAASLSGAKKALQDGRITEEQINASIKRVLKMKMKHNLITTNGRK